MSTWLQDLRISNPRLADAYAITGNQREHSLRQMVRALSMFPAMNTAADTARLNAAKYILSQRNRKAA